MRFRRRTHFVGSVAVRPPVPVLQQPYGIVEETEGTLLVADFRSNAVFRLNPATADGSRIANVPAPRDLRRALDGKVLVSSGQNVLELEPATRAIRVRAQAQGQLEGVAPALDASLYVVEDQTRVVHIARDGSRTVLASGLEGVHGVLATIDGVIVCESFAGNVRFIGAAGMRTVASGLGNPSYAAPGPGDRLYVTEFSANRVSQLDRFGTVQPVTTVPQPGPITTDRAGRLFVGTLNGTIYRVDPTTRARTKIWPK